MNSQSTKLASKPRATASGSPTTGSRTHVSLTSNVQDTPRSASGTDTTDIHQKKLDKLRDMYIKELGPTIPEVSWDFFTRAVLPRVPTDKLDLICEAVNASQSLVVNDRWKQFPLDPSHGNAPTENTAFSGMPDIWDGVIDIAQAQLGKEPVSRMQSWPDKSMTSETRLGATFRADSVTSLIQSRGANTGPGWGDPKGKHKASDKQVQAETQSEPPELLSREASVATSLWEYKCENKPDAMNDNVRKVVSGVSHILHNDPSRRYAFGITIEDTQIRVWYFSRSIVMASEAFDFMRKGRNWFIHLLVSLAFGTEVEMGFDPSVIRLTEWDRKGKPTIYYKLRVGNRWYRTIRILDNYRTSRVVGRATRIWEVRRDPGDVREGEQNQTFALKDVWIGETARSEKEILEHICSRANTIHRIEDFEPNFRQLYFMDILADEVVDVGGRPDTFSAFLGGIPFPQDHGLFVLEKDLGLPAQARTLPGSGSGVVVGALVPDVHELPANRQNAQKIPLFEARQHRRILFGEVGVTLGNVNNHQDYFRHLSWVVKGLKHLYSAGYVHRDLSTGNLLVCNGLCKITDLEYAKPYDVIEERLLENAAEHGFKTGTPAFMPIEVLDGIYRFYTKPIVTLPPSAEPSGSSNSGSPLTREAEEYLRLGAPMEPTPNPVRHNYLHDIESTWWIAMYGLATTVPLGTQESKATNDQLAGAMAVFRNRLECSTQRRDLLTNHQQLAKFVKKFLPEGYGAAAQYLIAMTMTLRNHFSSFEESLETKNSYTPARIADMHDYAKLMYSRAAPFAMKETTDLPGWKLKKMEAKVRRSKRRQDDEAEDSEVEDESVSKRIKFSEV